MQKRFGLQLIIVPDILLNVEFDRIGSIHEVDAAELMELETHSSTPFFFCCNSFFVSLEVSMNPSATVLDFQPPWRFTVKRSAPVSASNEADERRKQCPVYSPAFGNFKYSAISFGIFPNVLIPTGSLLHFLFLYPREKRFPAFCGLRLMYFFYQSYHIHSSNTTSCYKKNSRNFCFSCWLSYLDITAINFNIFHKKIC